MKAAGEPTPLPMLSMIGTTATTLVNGEAAAMMKQAMDVTPRVLRFRPWLLPPPSAGASAERTSCCWV